MDWEQVGEVGVDAGAVWIGDPCYIMGDDASHRVHNWDDFCDTLGDKGWPTTHQFDSGMYVSSGYGDGTYPVEVKRNHEGRIAEVRIVFISEDES